MNALIMSENRPQQIEDGIKTLTSRPVRQGDVFRAAWQNLPDAVLSNGRVKWEVGGVAGIKPGRILPVCLVDCAGKVVTDLRAEWLRFYGFRDSAADSVSAKQMRDDLLQIGVPELPDYRMQRVQVLALKRYDVRDMTQDEALAEGFADVQSYLEWWTQTYDPETRQQIAWFDGVPSDSEIEYELTGETRPAHLCSRSIITPHGEVYNAHDYLLTRPVKLYDAWQIRFQRVLA